MTTTAVPDVACISWGCSYSWEPPRESGICSVLISPGGTEPGTGCRPGDTRSSLCSPAPMSPNCSLARVPGGLCHGDRAPSSPLQLSEWGSGPLPTPPVPPDPPVPPTLTLRVPDTCSPRVNSLCHLLPFPSFKAPLTEDDLGGWRGLDLRPPPPSVSPRGRAGNPTWGWGGTGAGSASGQILRGPRALAPRPGLVGCLQKEQGGSRGTAEGGWGAGGPRAIRKGGEVFKETAGGWGVGGTPPTFQAPNGRRPFVM